MSTSTNPYRDTKHRVRDYIRAKPGVRRVRIRSNGHVEVYGEMPNTTHVIGWYFAGYVQDLAREAKAYLSRSTHAAANEALVDGVLKAFREGT